MKTNRLIIILLFLASFGMAYSNLSLSNQGTDVRLVSNGSTVDGADLTILLYNDSSDLIYNNTFTAAIVNGSWNVMMDNLTLDFNAKYWMDYAINGEDIDFDGAETLGFNSPLGTVNWSDIANAPAGGPESDPYWSANYSLFNDSWSSTYNSSYLTSFTEADPLWSGNYSAFNDTWSSTYNATYDAKVSDNQTWNETRANALYYTLTNPAAYWNTTYAAFNKTYADTLYSTVAEPLWSGNSSTVARTGTCGAGQVAQNITSSGPQCVADQTGSGSTTVRGYLGGNSGASYSADGYFHPNGGGSGSTTPDQAMMFPFAAKIHNMSFTMSAAQGSSDLCDMYVQSATTANDAFSSSTITCRIGTGEIKCTDTTHSLSVPAGSFVKMFFDEAGGTCVGQLGWSIVYDYT